MGHWSQTTKRVVAVLAASLFTLPATSAHPQPLAGAARPVTLVVPFAAGGGIDSVARIFAEKMQEELQQPVAVENRTGAGGIVGINSVAKAAPDGHTLLVMEASSVLAKWLHKDVPFRVTQDLAPVAMIATTSLGLFAGPAVAASDVRELIAYSKAHPDELSVGTPGIGSPHHLAALMLDRLAGIHIAHVPYRGTAPSLNDLLAGRIPLIWAVPIAVKPFVDEGKVKALGVSGTQRVAMLPQVPTIAESALPAFKLTLWLGVAAPAGTPSDILARLSEVVRSVTQRADVQERMAELGYDLVFHDRDAFAHVIADEEKEYGEIIRAAGIQPQ
jgi:tripartite-type tricarboxylate transporter receptor subunit TctC